MYKTLWFTHSAHEEMRRLALQTAVDGLEAGGHLYGYTYPSTGDVVVTLVLPAGPNSKRTWNGLDWDHEALKEYDRRYVGNAQWEVGDFHTHPVPSADPSQIDTAGTIQWREGVNWNPLYPDVMVILGVPRGGSIGQVGAWFWPSATERITMDIRVASPEWNPVDDNGNWIERGA